MGHHSKIGNNVFIASHAVISGRCTIGDNCFVGVNATFRDNISVAEDCVIGAGALCLRTRALPESTRRRRPIPRNDAAANCGPTSAGRKGSSSHWPSASAEPRNARICRDRFGGPLASAA